MSSEATVLLIALPSQATNVAGLGPVAGAFLPRLEGTEKKIEATLLLRSILTAIKIPSFLAHQKDSCIPGIDSTLAAKPQSPNAEPLAPSQSPEAHSSCCAPCSSKNFGLLGLNPKPGPNRHRHHCKVCLRDPPGNCCTVLELRIFPQQGQPPECYAPPLRSILQASRCEISCRVLENSELKFEFWGAGLGV